MVGCDNKVFYAEELHASYGDLQNGQFELPSGNPWGLTNNRRAVKIDCPIENNDLISFPVSVALVEWTDGETITRALVRVHQRGNRYQGFALLSKLFPNINLWECTSGRIFITAVTLSPNILLRVTSEQVDEFCAEEPTNICLRLLQRTCRQLCIEEPMLWRYC
jgi:hypothetical protein